MEVCQKNYLKSIGFVEHDENVYDKTAINPSDDLIKQERSISPIETLEETEVHIVKSEEIETAVQVIDLQIGKENTTDDDSYDQIDSKLFTACNEFRVQLIHASIMVTDLKNIFVVLPVIILVRST